MTKKELGEVVAAVKREVAKDLRAEIDRLGTQRSAFTGWQAVEVSLRRIAESLERDVS